MMEGKNVNDQYLIFCRTYTEGVIKFILDKHNRTNKIKQWVNYNCIKDMEKRDNLWNRFRRHKSKRAYNNCKRTRNAYTKIRSEAQVEYQNDIFNTSKDQPKLFYSYIQSKTKAKDKIRSTMNEMFNE